MNTGTRSRARLLPRTGSTPFSHRTEFAREGRHDAEVLLSGSPKESPEEIRAPSAGGCDCGAVGQRHPHFHHVVRAETALPRQESVPAAQRASAFGNGLAESKDASVAVGFQHLIQNVSNSNSRSRGHEHGCIFSVVAAVSRKLKVEVPAQGEDDDAVADGAPTGVMVMVSAGPDLHHGRRQPPRTGSTRAPPPQNSSPPGRRSPVPRSDRVRRALMA
jgi:hypothetical protein